MRFLHCFFKKMFVCARTNPSAAGSNVHRYAAPAFESWQAELVRGIRMTERRRPPVAARSESALESSSKCGRWNRVVFAVIARSVIPIEIVITGQKRVFAPGDPVIHLLRKIFCEDGWMPGSSPGMTSAFCGARQEVLRTPIPYSIFKQPKTIRCRAVIPGWSQRVGALRRPMTGSGPDLRCAICASGNLEIPGSRGACHRAALCADPLARPGMTHVPVSACPSQEALRIDVDFELEVALGLRTGSQPFAQIVGQIDIAQRFHQYPKTIAALDHGERRFGGAQHLNSRIDRRDRGEPARKTLRRRPIARGNNQARQPAERRIAGALAGLDLAGVKRLAVARHQRLHDGMFGLVGLQIADPAAP